MDYEKEIKQKRKEIDELIQKQAELLVKEYPDIAWKFYSLTPIIFCKIKSVDHVFDKNKCNCTAIRVVYSNTQVSVSCAAIVTIDISDVLEITEDDFNAVYDKAMNKLLTLK